MNRARVQSARIARLHSQLLAGEPAHSVEAVVERLLAVQAQDARGARLAIRSRSAGLKAVDVDRALSLDRSLVVTWLNRGTLHLVRSEDYWWLHQLTASRSKLGSERRLREEGVDARQAVRGVELIAEAVTADGPLTRAQLRERLEASAVPTGGQAIVHLLAVASSEGMVVRGPMVGADQAFVSVDRWLGPAPPTLHREEALAKLARRYLSGHAPARPEDLAKWAGITLSDARACFAAIDREYESTDEGFLAPSALGGSPVPTPRLLGPFDPLLHGWVSREPFVGQHVGVVTTNGIFRPVALVDGRVVAIWSLPRGQPTIVPLERLSAPVRRTLAEDSADVLRFLGMPDRAVDFAPR